MSWCDGFWEDYAAPFVDASIYFTAGLLETAGQLSSVAGGLATSLAWAAEQSVSADYYLNARLNGTVLLDFDIRHFFNINETIPFNLIGDEEGGLATDLNQYIQGPSLMYYAYTCSTVGIGLCVLGASLKHWLRGRKDVIAHEEKGRKLASPSLGSHGWVTLRAASQAACLISFSTAGATWFLRQWMASEEINGITYPASSPFSVNTKDYSGYVQSSLFPFEIEISKNETIFPGTEFPIVFEQKATVSGETNMTYGGGIFLEPSLSFNLPISIGSITGLLTRGLGLFAESQEQKDRDKRISTSTEADSLNNYRLFDV